MTWKKKIGWTALIVLGIAVALVGTAYIAVHTKAFNRWMLSKVIQEAQKSTGSRVAIEGMAIDWEKLDVDLYGVVLYGAGSEAIPLFEAEHLRVGLKIISLLRRKFELTELILDRPQVNLLVDAQGQSNVPHPSNERKSSNPTNTIFELKIGYVAVNSGQIHYNDRETPLVAELQNFHAQIHYGLLSSEYKGSVGYEHGCIQIKDFNPIEHDALMQFTANRMGIAVEQLLVTTGKSHISVSAQLSDYVAPTVEGKYEAVIFTEELAGTLKNSAVPIGQATTEGTFRYHDVPYQSFLDAAQVAGRLGSLELKVREGQISAPVKSVQCKYSLEQGNLRVDDLHANLLNGQLIGSMEMDHLEGNTKSRVNAVLKSVSLSAVNAALPPGKYRSISVVGTANANVQASWSNNFRNLVVLTRMMISSGSRKNAQSSAIPVEGNIDVKYDAARDSASFGHSYLTTRSTQLSLSGIVSKQSDLNVQAHTSDLYETAVLADKIQSAAQGNAKSNSEPYDVHGSAQFTGQVHGTVTAPALRGQLSASGLQVDGSQWRMLQTAIDLSPSQVALQNGFLAGSKQGQITFRGSMALRKWAIKPTSPISLHATAANLSLADFERLANEKYPVSGILSGNVAIDGSEEAPSGQGSIQITKASAWDQTIRGLTVRFEGTNHEIHSTAEVQTPAGTVSADITYSFPTEAYVASVMTSGLRLDQIRSLQNSKLGVSGILTASGSGRGTLQEPQFTATVGVPQLQVRGETISQVQAHLALAQQRIKFSIESLVAQGTMMASGDLGLTGSYPATASVNIRNLPIGPLVASYIPGSVAGLEGQTEVHATLTGPLKDPAQLAIQLEIPTLSMQYRSAQIALVQPLKAEYRDGVVSVQRTQLKGNGTDLTVQGTLPIRNLNQSRLTANGTVDLSLLQGFTNNVQSSGHIDVNLSAGGGFSTGAVRGQLRIVNATLTTETIPVGLEGINGEIKVTGNRLDISQFSGKAGGGQIDLGGFLVYGSQSSFNVNLGAKDVRIRYPEGLRSVLSGDVRLIGAQSDSTLSGRVILDKLSFTQQFDLSNFVGQFGSSLPSTEASSFQQNMKLNVSLQSADQLSLASNKVSIAGAVNLAVTGTLASPIVLGRVTLTGGDLFFLGKRYTVDTGTIEFSNPVTTAPVLDLYVETNVENYDIKVHFTGPVDRMRTDYTSTPALPPSDIINLITLGQTAEESATSSTPASLGAESVLAQGVGSQVSGKLEQLTGITQLSLNPMAGNNDNNPGAQVAVQQRVTANLLVTFSTDVNSTQATAVQVQYQMTPETSVSVLRDQNGGYALTLRLHKTF